MNEMSLFPPEVPWVIALVHVIPVAILGYIWLVMVPDLSALSDEYLRGLLVAIIPASAGYVWLRVLRGFRLSFDTASGSLTQRIARWVNLAVAIACVAELTSWWFNKRGR